MIGAKYPQQKIIRINFKELSFEHITDSIINFIQKYDLYDKIIEDKNSYSIIWYLFDKKQYNFQNNIHIKLLNTERKPSNLYHYILYHNQFDLLKILVQKCMCTGLDFFEYMSKNFEHINSSNVPKIELNSVLTCLHILFSNNFLNPNLVYHPNREFCRYRGNKGEKIYVLYTLLRSGYVEIIKLWDQYKERDSDYFLYKNVDKVPSLWQAVFGLYPDDRAKKKCSTEKYKKEISEFLLQKDIDPNEQTEGKFTPLHLARIYSPELLETFLKYGANIFIKSNLNQTPLNHTMEHIATQEELEKYIEVLKKYDHKVSIESGFNQKKYIIEKNNDLLKLQVSLIGQNIKIIKVTCLN